MRVRVTTGLAAGVVSSVLSLAAFNTFAAAPGEILVHVDKPAAKIDPLFYGLMTEEINHSYDGGLYAELIQNRIFQDPDPTSKVDPPRQPPHWSVVKSDNADGGVVLDESKPVNGGALNRSLRLDVKKIAAGERVGVANDGYWGIPVWPNTKYHASFYARATNDFTGPLTVTIENAETGKAAATTTVESVTSDWKKFEVDLSTGKEETSTANRFVISAGKPGSVWFSLVSLFPPTYHDRPNGFRIDLMQKLADLHPKFLRFPGGNFVEGDTIPTRFDWKKTIGPLEDRPGHMGCWSYRVSDGMGLLEFLEWCEDLKMEPLLAVYAGYSLKGEHVDAGPNLEPFVQEALEEIEYCTGDENTTWGKRRAQDGHPAPFVIHNIEIGNEDWFDKSKSYDGRFAQFFDAIKAKYPNLKCISTMEVKSRKPDLRDDHAYPSPSAMLKSVGKYDGYAADHPRVFFGEWATRSGRATPCLRDALSDAAWLTGLQRNSDTVIMQCYAPLFVNVNKGGMQWSTDLIGFDAASSFGSTSYWAQAMFAKAWGDQNLPTQVTAPEMDAVEPDPKGFVGVGTWRTAAEFKDIKVTHKGTEGEQTLFTADLTKPIDKDWKRVGKSWTVKDGVLAQTDAKPENQRITFGDSTWTDYTLTLKARKVSGNEGFLILVHGADNDNYRWFNIGGWGNAETGVERAIDGDKEELAPRVPVKIDTDKWYDIRVEAAGKTLKLFLDDKPVLDATETPYKPKTGIYAASSTEDATGDIIVKVVNIAPAPQSLQIDLQGATNVKPEATVEYISGELNDVNTLESPTKIAPKTQTLKDVSAKFTHEFPAQSVSVIRLKTK